MKAVFMNILCTLLMILFVSTPIFGQRISSVALNDVAYSSLPYLNKKRVLFPALVGVDNPVGVSDKLYDDLQCTQFFHAGNDEDLSPSLYLKVKIPNSNFIIGALTYGGATDYRTDQLFISDLSGNIKSSLESTIMNSCISIKQYQITKDCKIIISQLILTSATPLLYKDFINKNKTIQAYRLDTTYSVNSNGMFVKEGEYKHPIKTYSEKQMDDNNIWDL